MQTNHNTIVASPETQQRMIEKAIRSLSALRAVSNNTVDRSDLENAISTIQKLQVKNDESNHAA